MNKFQKIACNLARYELANKKAFTGETFNSIRNNYYNISMKKFRKDIKDAIDFKNFIKGRN